MTFGALYAGIQAAGLFGAVVALVGLQTLEAAIVVVAVGRRLGFIASDLRHLAPALNMVLATGAATLAAFAVKFPLAHAIAPVRLVLCGAVFGAVYIFAAYTLGAVTGAEKTEIRAMLSICLARLLSRWSRARQRFGATSATID
jgi:hypothetical protein